MKATIRERGILFSGPMVRAILEGRKTVTRRVVTWRSGDTGSVRPLGNDLMWPHELVFPRARAETYRPMTCPYGQPSDKLWVRETWALLWPQTDPETGYVDDFREWPTHRPIPKEHPGEGWCVYYAADWADDSDTAEARGFRWRPSLFLPRWASRLTLEVVSVRVERLQGISEEDARAEGVKGLEKWLAGGDATHDPDSAEEFAMRVSPRRCFRRLWEHINSPESWAANPWVWRIEFRRVP